MQFDQSNIIIHVALAGASYNRIMYGDTYGLQIGLLTIL